MSTTERAPSTWPAMVRIIVARTALIFLAGLLLWALVLLPFPGFSGTTVSSGSMRPSVDVGSVVVTKAPGSDTELLGRVVTFRDPAHEGRLVTHRIIADHGDATYTTRGDANRTADSTSVARSDVVGRGFILVPWIGLPAIWLRDGNVLALVLTTGAIVGLLAASRQSASLARRDRRRPAIAQIAGLAGTAAAIALLMTAVAMPHSSSAFTEMTANTANGWRTAAATTAVLYTDHGNTAMFDTTLDGRLQHNVAVSKLIDVTYAGTTPADIQMYFTNDPAMNNLIQFLQVTIERGTVSAGVFTPAAAPIYQGLMSGLAWSHNNPYNGPIDTGWNPTGAASQTQTFRVTVRLDPAAQGWPVPTEGARMDFTWFDMNLRGQPTMPTATNASNTWAPALP